MTMRTYITRPNGDCWSGEEWINLSVVPGARDACDFESYAAATGYLDAALESDDSGNFANASIVEVEHADEALEYRIAYMLEAPGEFEVVETFRAASDADANAYAEANHDGEWYVLNAAGRNINAGIDG
jgi:hypothetical protein